MTNDTNVAVLERHEVVQNEKYGLGTVLESDAQRTTVDFDEAGVKTYDTAIATSVSSLPELGDDYDIETWHKQLAACHKQRGKHQWTIGDSIIVAINSAKKWQKNHNDLLELAANDAGVKLASVYSFWRVASVFPKHCRHLELSFSHHQTVASIDDETIDHAKGEHTKDEWLTLAETNKWNSEEFRLKVYQKKTKKVSVHLPVEMYLVLKAEMDALNRERYEMNQNCVDKIPEATISDIVVGRLLNESSQTKEEK
jgi:hypothetical protein